MGQDVAAMIEEAFLAQSRRLLGIYAVVEHFSMHTGQLIAFAKMWKGDLGFYELSHGAPRPAWYGGKDGD
jgi:hypothetical protein